MFMINNMTRPGSREGYPGKLVTRFQEAIQRCLRREPWSVVMVMIMIWNYDHGDDHDLFGITIMVTIMIWYHDDLH